MTTTIDSLLATVELAFAPPRSRSPSRSGWPRRHGGRGRAGRASPTRWSSGHQRRRHALDKHADWLRKASLAGDPDLADAARGRAREWQAIAADCEQVLAEHTAGRLRLAVAVDALRAAITR